MKALVINRPGEMEIKLVPIPQPGLDEVLIKVQASGICGTDVHIFDGGFPAAYPLIPGHEFCGDIVKVGAGCMRIRPGQRVAVEPNIPCNNCAECLRGEHHYCQNMIVPGVNAPGGFAEYVVVKEWGVFSIGELAFEKAALIEPLSCVIHAIDRLAPQPAERALVMGAGPIGLLLGRMLKLKGVAQVDYLERFDERRKNAAQDGLGLLFADVKDVPEQSYACILDATGSSLLVSEAANRLTQARGKVLIFGVPKHDAEIHLNHFRIYREEIQLIASFTSLKNTLQAIELMRSGTINLDRIVSNKISLADAPDYIHRMKNGDGEIKKVILIDFQ